MVKKKDSLSGEFIDLRGVIYTFSENSRSGMSLSMQRKSILGDFLIQQQHFPVISVGTMLYRNNHNYSE